MPHRFGALCVAQRFKEQDGTSEVAVVDGRTEFNETFVQTVSMLGGSFECFDFSATLKFFRNVNKIRIVIFLQLDFKVELFKGVEPSEELIF